MNKKGQAEEVIGWTLLIMLILITLFGFFSANICNRLLIGVGISGLIWLFFETPIITRVEARGFIFFLPLTFVLLIIWIILRATGICLPISEIIKTLNPIK